MNDTLRRLTPIAAMVAASPAFACGGPRFSGAQLGVLTVSMVAAPLLAALLVDRGAFSLAAHALGMKRKHRPTAVGPILALLAVTVAMAGLGSRNVDMAIAALTVVPVAAVVCGLSFVRSVIIEQRGHPRAQALRVAAVALFSSLAIIPFMH